MPELPEVETVRLQLLHKILNKRIQRVEVFHHKTVENNPNFSESLVGKSFLHIDRIGKLLIFHLAKEPDLFILAHLKMTGQFFYRDQAGIIGGGHSMTPSDTRELPGRHTRVAFYFTGNSVLFFNDMRLFGYLKLATAEEVSKAKARFGQEPIADDFDTELFASALKKRRTPIKAALLDQTFIAGLGNIYVDEALFASAVRPTRIANKVTKREAYAIAKASGEVMKKSILVGGTTFQHFADTGGGRGNFTEYLQVFGKQNTPCPNCQTMIKKIRIAGRGTHYCPSCQK